ncbi:MAG: flavodoxin family protein [Bacteroidales bacterium]|nr:flavodoxin family protein [Bacteroidales bacterium]
MVEKQLKAMFFNGSPRKNKNTAQMLESAMKGAQEAGAEVELIHLQDLNFKGCVSCFACKRKGNTCGGLCIQKDDLRPVLERILEADVLVLGTPVYFSFATGMFRNLMERLLFPIMSYSRDEQTGGQMLYLHKRLQTAIIYTMNCPNEEIYNQFHYDTLLSQDCHFMERMFGYCEQLNAQNTWQFPDYSKFDANLIDLADREYTRQHQWPKDLQNAYDLGKRLVEKAKEQ